MNIIKIMIPKISTVFLHENDTVRQGLERFRAHGYTAIPVLNEEEQYVGCLLYTSYRYADLCSRCRVFLHRNYYGSDCFDFRMDVSVLI